PITANGKVNRARLLEMEVTFTRENAYQAATNELEEKLVAIWEDVLGVERIGIQDNFFELGGHSLGVIKLMSTIQREFGKSLSYRDLYIDSTISKLAKKIESIEEEYANTIPVLEASELYDVSFAQRRMWIINELNPQSIAYNMPGRFVIKDTEPEEAFKATINALVMKHESFRTSFIEKDGDVFQKIEEYQAVELDIEDLMQLQEEEKYQKMLDAESLIFAQPFNLKESGLYRMKILKINVDHYEVLFCIHHIISDGVSMGIIRNEFFKYYENYKQNKRLPITPLKIQYKDFAAWQNNIIEEKMDEALHYWERKFVNFPDKLLLPERMIMDYDGNDGQYNVVIDNDLNQKIKALVSTTQISVFSLFLSSLYVLLNRMTGQDDIIIGSPVAGREHFETEEIVGCFVNTLILREKINRNERFDHFLQHVSTSVSEAVTYQAYPLELVLENLQMKYPDIQVFLNIINFSDVNELKNSSQYDFSKNVNVKFDMIFYITPLDDRILLTCEYRKTKFKNTDIQHIVGELIKVISDAASHSEKSISEIGLTTRRRLVKR
ncbi:condensation domain-containing protein, partial [Mesobacillus zeae]